MYSSSKKIKVDVQKERSCDGTVLEREARLMYRKRGRVYGTVLEGEASLMTIER